MASKYSDALRRHGAKPECRPAEHLRPPSQVPLVFVAAILLLSFSSFGALRYMPPHHAITHYRL